MSHINKSAWIVHAFRRMILSLPVTQAITETSHKTDNPLLH